MALKKKIESKGVKKADKIVVGVKKMPVKKVKTEIKVTPPLAKTIVKTNVVKKSTPKEEIKTKVVEVKRVEKGSAHVKVQTAEGWKRMMKKRGLLKK